ncbi:MAG: hypothetical protein WDN28_13075 [Chthoniobacter sp.]
MGEVHRLGHGIAVVRGDDDHVDPFRDQGLDVGHLADVIPIRALHPHVGTECGGLFNEVVPVALPALFLESVQRKADQGAGVFCTGKRGRTGARQDQAGGHADQAGENDESETQFHPE